MPTQKKKKKKKKKKNWTANPGKEKKRKEKKKSQKVVKSCGCRSLHVCLFTKMPLSYELWKLKTAFSCFQFP